MQCIKENKVELNKEISTFIDNLLTDKENLTRKEKVKYESYKLKKERREAKLDKNDKAEGELEAEDKVEDINMSEIKRV